MDQVVQNKVYDLEERTFLFAKNCRLYIRKLQKNFIVVEDCKQLVRSSGSVGANYIEANESLGPKDFIMRVRIARKEAKESCFWLKLLENSDNRFEEERKILLNESTQLMNIMAAILKKYKTSLP